jgi:hypothetical protein
MSDDPLELRIPDALWNAVRRCEIHCVAACCGENAFELTPENLSFWAWAAPPDRVELVLRQIDELIDQLARLGPNARLKWFSSDCSDGPRHWLKDVRECVLETTNPPQRLPDGTPIVRRVRAKLRVLTSGETFNGHLMPAKPFDRAGVEVLLPDRPLWTEVKLPVKQVDPGQRLVAELRFPLPARIQSWLKVGGTLDLDHHRGTKTIDATILSFDG